MAPVIARMGDGVDCPYYISVIFSIQASEALSIPSTAVPAPAQRNIHVDTRRGSSISTPELSARSRVSECSGRRWGRSGCFALPTRRRVYVAGCRGYSFDTGSYRPCGRLCQPESHPRPEIAYADIIAMLGCHIGVRIVHLGACLGVADGQVDIHYVLGDGYRRGLFSEVVQTGSSSATAPTATPPGRRCHQGAALRGGRPSLMLPRARS